MQKVDGDIFGIALATHETFFREDKMQWLQNNAEAIDWSSCPVLRQQVMSYGPFAPEPDPSSEPANTSDTIKTDPSDDIPF
jgi:hypothetical protein